MLTAAKLVLVTLCWGLSFIATKIALRAYDPVTVLTLRLFLASLALRVLWMIGKGEEKSPRGKDLLGFLFLGFLNPFLAFLLEGYAMTDTSASIASIVLATVPLFTPIAAFIAWRERISARNFLGLALSFCGIALIILRGAEIREFSLRGLALLLAAVIVALVYGIAAKNLLKRYSPLAVVSYQMGFGFLLYIPVFLAFSDKQLLVAAGQGIAAPASILFLALFPSALAYTLYVGAIEKIGPSKANAFINLSPVVTSIASFFLLGEDMAVPKLIGIAVVIAGVFIAQGKGRLNPDGKDSS